MNKKSLLITLLLALIILFPAAVLAADYTLIRGVFNLSRYASGDRVAVAPGAAVTLTGTAPGNVTVSCGSGVTLTLLNVSIDNSATGNSCALHFTGMGNSLILSGTSTLKSGYNKAGIQVGEATELYISGTGILNAYGGNYGAGIGGGHTENAGSISISGGTVNATGGYAGAGIGGGYTKGGGTITISGGTVNAAGGTEGAGIGGGYLGNGGSITVSGATVYATGGIAGAGIGGGRSGDGGNIIILGGYVCATGGGQGAGIGGGYTEAGGIISIAGGMVNATGGWASAGIGGGNHGSGGTISIAGGTVAAIGGSDTVGIGGGRGHNGGDITISGGIVYAEKGPQRTALVPPYDIGPGIETDFGTLTISNIAAVFLRHDKCFTPSLPGGHVHKTPSDATDAMVFTGAGVYGITVPTGASSVPDWTGALGGYFKLTTITYNANGGRGTPPASPPVQHVGTTVIAASGSSLMRTGFSFSGWNTQAGGGGISYAPGDPVVLTSGLTLFAIWEAYAPIPLPIQTAPATRVFTVPEPTIPAQTAEPTPTPSELPIVR